jgi:hypothetical protein
VKCLSARFISSCFFDDVNVGLGYEWWSDFPAASASCRTNANIGHTYVFSRENARETAGPVESLSIVVVISAYP